MMMSNFSHQKRQTTAVTPVLITAEEYIYLWESVWGKGPSLEQTKPEMDNTLFSVSFFRR